jgi:hypothetical protein
MVPTLKLKGLGIYSRPAQLSVPDSAGRKKKLGNEQGGKKLLANELVVKAD